MIERWAEQELMWCFFRVGRQLVIWLVEDSYIEHVY
jgi:hypothetical protein